MPLKRKTTKKTSKKITPVQVVETAKGNVQLIVNGVVKRVFRNKQEYEQSK